MSGTSKGSWEGGIIRGGRFYIRRQLDGKRHEIPVGKTREAALAELALFNRDSRAYIRQRQAKREDAMLQADGLYLDAALVGRFLDWSEAKVNRNKTRGNSRKWGSIQDSTLVWWAKQLAGRDLRHLHAREIDKLRTPRGWRIRVVVLKSVYKWLRRHEHLIEASQDPTLDLETPRIARAQDSASKVFSLTDFNRIHSWLVSTPYPLGRLKRRKNARSRAGRATRAWTREATALLLEILMGSGLHVRETLRFAFAGDIKPYAPDKATDLEAGIITTPLAKKGSRHSVPVSRRVLKAAQKLRALAKPLGYEINSSEEENTYRAIFEDVAAAKTALGITSFGAGWARHTVATFAAEHGSLDETIAQHLGNSAAMVAQNYATRAVRPKLPTPI